MDGKFLSQKRIKVGLSQNQIAEQLGYSVQMISLWENDKGSPNLNVWSKYASMLKVDLEGFILGVDKKENNLCNEIKFNNVSFANNMRAIRKKASLTQVSLARILHLNVSSIIRFEKGTSTPNKYQFIAICNYYHIAFDALYFCIESPLPVSLVKQNKKRRFFLLFFPIFITVSTAGAGVTTYATIETRRNRITATYDVENGQSGNNIESNNEETQNQNNPIDTTNEQNNPNNGETNNPVVEIEENVVTFGSYPQHHIYDEELLDALNSLETPNELGYYSYQGSLYEKCTATLIEGYPDGGYYFDNDEKIINGKTYWYKVEPLKWVIVGEDDNSYLITTVNAIDGRQYSLTSNNYKDSILRDFLINEFYNKAFDGIKDNILLTEVDNSLESTGDDVSHFTCENTFDYVFALSANDLNPEIESIINENEYRICYLSEYARGKKVYSSGYSGLMYSSYYWTRSPSSYGSTFSYFISFWGHLDRKGVEEDGAAIRPAIRIKK